MHKYKLCCSVIVALLSAVTFTPTSAHDTWVQVDTLLARTDDIVHVDVMLGNHGNNHRDFKLSSKISLAPWTLEVVNPQGDRQDIKPSVVDAGYGPKEGFWSARFETGESGTYSIVHKLDTLHGRTRALKTSKTFVFASKDGANTNIEKTNNEATESHSATSPIEIGANLELVLLTPITSLSAGQEMEFIVKQHGKPVADQVVTFIPRGANLGPDFDPQFERTSDNSGRISFTPAHANLYLVVAHKAAPDESGEGYDKTHYSATLMLPVPKRPLAN